MSGIVITDRRGNAIQANSDVGPAASGYDAANSSPLRSTLGGFPTNSRVEISAFTRKQIVKKVRALDANLGFIGRIKQKTGQHAVGKGIFARPATRDEEWNQLALQHWERIAENPELHAIDGSRDLYEDQRLAAEAPIDDGEYFAALVRDEAGNLMVQPLDVFEVDQPFGSDPAAGPDWHDGVRIDDYGRALDYAVRELPGPFSAPAALSRIVEAGQMLHLFKRRRPKQWRGLPMVYAGVNSLIDVLDLKSLEVGSAKLHSALGLVVKKQNGDSGKKGVSNQITKMLDGAGQITKVGEKFWQGAGIQYMGLDEGIELLTSDRPSPNLLAFMEWLYRDASVGTGLPIEVLYEMSKLGGANTRAVLEDAQWFFEMIQDSVVMRHSRPLYILRIADAIAKGELRPCRDPQWWICDWQGPAKLTVDVGRTADANIKLMRNGLATFEGFYEERGLNARTQHTRQIKHLSWLKQECEREGVPIEWIIEPTPGVQLNIAGATPAEQQS
jgi:capsid protein